MTNDPLEVRTMKAVIRMADTLHDISQKLDYIIKKQTNNYLHHRRNEKRNNNRY